MLAAYCECLELYERCRTEVDTRAFELRETLAVVRPSAILSISGLPLS
jgi:hypothetical protein